MAQFLQIGEMGYNVDQIQLINMAGGQTVKIWFLDHPEVDTTVFLHELGHAISMTLWAPPNPMEIHCGIDWCTMNWISEDNVGTNRYCAAHLAEMDLLQINS